MAISLKRLVAAVVALAFLVATMASLAACSMAYAAAAARVGIAAHAAQPKADGAQHATCLDHTGCVVAPALPASPPVLRVVLEWTLPDYHAALARLAGVSLEPDLSPPIPAS